MKFGLVGEGDQIKFLRDLIPLEAGLVYGDAIGKVTEFPFSFQVHDCTPIRHRPIPYARVERDWIN